MFRFFQQPDMQYVLILSGDQLYRMDFRQTIACHEKSGADVSIAAVPVSSGQASGLGIMPVNESGRVVGFLEKPQTEQELDLVRTDPAWIQRQGFPARGRDCLANMGIYLFNRKTLVEVLEKTNYRDFGKEVFPASIRTRRVQIHLCDGYWEDIGTIKSFYEANLAMATANSPFSLLSSASPIFSRPRFLPPARLDGATVRHSLISDGCVLDEGVVVENSVIGLRCRIGRDVVIRNSILMGHDFFESHDDGSPSCSDGVPLGIGDGCRIEGAIIDKNCHIGRDVRIVNSSGVESTAESPYGMIRDRIAVIPKNVTLPDGWSLD
jgi:glucose-1-phosphate adenylyltransferase